MFTFCKARWARRKKRKENHATKVTKIPKTKRQKYGMNETKVVSFFCFDEKWPNFKLCHFSTTKKNKLFVLHNECVYLLIIKEKINKWNKSDWSKNSLRCGEQLNCSLVIGNSKYFYGLYENCCQRHYILFIKKETHWHLKTLKSWKSETTTKEFNFKFGFFFSGKSMYRRWKQKHDFRFCYFY